MTGHEELVCVKVFPTEEEAEIAQGLLESNGLRVMLSKEGADPAREGILEKGVKLLVRKEDLNKASKILNDKK